MIYIIGGIYHYNKDSDGIKITTHFIIAPIAIILYGAYVRKGNGNIASLIISTTCITFGFLFWKYTTNINPNDTLKEIEKREEDRRTKKGGQE